MKKYSVRTFINCVVLFITAAGLGILGLAEAEARQIKSEEFAYTDRQGIIYTMYDNNTCYVSGYENKGSTAVIPVKIKSGGSTYRVKGIEKAAFRRCTALKKLEIPNSVTDISGKVFDGCKNLSKIRIKPVRYAAKISGRTAVVTVKINSALLSTKADVKLKAGRDVLDEAVSDKKSTAVTLKISTADNKNYPAADDDRPGSVILQKEAVKAAARSGKSFKARIKNARGCSYYIKISAGELKKAGGDLRLAIRKQSADSTSGTVKADMNSLVQQNGLGKGSAGFFSYSFDKASKIKVNMVLPVQDMAGVSAKSSVYVYRYNKTKRKFVSLSYHPYTVSKQGNISFFTTRGGYYAVTGTQLVHMAGKPKSQFLNESDGTYYVDKHGALAYGWRNIGGEYYYFDRENGRMASGSTVDGIQIQKNGTARKTEAYVNKIQTMIKARAVVEQITLKTDSSSQKIEKCFRWIFQFPYRQYRSLNPLYRQEGWEVLFANDIFDRHMGCCVSEAAATAFLFHECGYKTVYVCHDTGHAWVELDGRVYDPLFAEARGFDRYYNVSYQQYGLYPVGRQLI